MRTAGERQPEQPRHLVERLARRVVDGAPSERTSSVTSGTSSRTECPPDTSSAIVGSGSGPCSSDVHRDVGREVVHAVQRHAERDRERLRRGDADQQRAGEAGAGGHGDRVEVGEPRRRPRGSARSIVGTIASRCARLATSGTTPPKRACSSTLLATASASSVLAADDPDAGLVAGGLDAQHQGPVVQSASVLQVQPHDVRVDVAGLVVLASASSG